MRKGRFPKSGKSKKNKKEKLKNTTEVQKKNVAQQEP